MKIVQVSILLTVISLIVSACASGELNQSRVARGAIALTATSVALRPVLTATYSTSISASPVPLRTNGASATVSHPPTETAVASMPTVQIMPTATIEPTDVLPTVRATANPTTVPTPALTAVATDDLIVVNGMPVPDIVVMPTDVRENVRRIFLKGKQIGRNARAFSKLGDSVTLTDHYLTRFDSGYYDLGPYDYLQPAIDYYQGSFLRYGVATRVGLHAWSIFDPLWANKEWCLPEESIVSCELRLHNPSVLLIKIGSNDNGAGSVFEENLRLLLEYCVESGVVPVLGTKADRFEGPDDRNNQIIRQLAQEYAIPLWDYDRISDTLPRRGLSGDDVHMTMADADDYSKPETFERGYPVSDLTALMTLYEVMFEVVAASDP